MYNGGGRVLADNPSAVGVSQPIPPSKMQQNLVAYSALRDFLLMEMDEAPDVIDWPAVWADLEKHKS